MTIVFWCSIMEYFKDRTALVEALKAGVLDLHEEMTSRDWATAYNTKSVAEGRLIKEVLPDGTPSGAQGFYLNMRRDKFKDIRVRKALDLAFDFEWTNANLFYGSYKRTASFFENSPLKAEGKPSPEELKILEPFRKDLRPEVFDEVYVPPVSDGSGQDRKLLRQAAQLLTEAGWTRKGTELENAKGEKLTIEFFIDDPASERFIAPFVKNLKLLGIGATMALLYLINSWSVAEWTEAMRRLAPDLDIRTWPEIGNQADITYSVAWLPPANVLRSLPNLKVIFSLGAGVDAILKDPTLPEDVPIARVNEPDLTMRMTEYVVLQVLMHHRQQRRMDESQRQRRWDSFATHSASAMLWPACRGRARCRARI